MFGSDLCFSSSDRTSSNAGLIVESKSAATSENYWACAALVLASRLFSRVFVQIQNKVPPIIVAYNVKVGQLFTASFRPERMTKSVRFVIFNDFSYNLNF
jgi:hypothetical protein